MSETDTARRRARFRVHRRKAGDTAARYDVFEVLVGPWSTVLDGLVAIRTKQDPTLTLRHACFHAECGTCAMRVNGQEGLACVTPVGDADEVTVEPLANLPLVSDLVVDMSAFYERFDIAARPLVRGSETPAEPVLPEGVDRYTRFEDCIECGICVSACPIAGSDPHYLGPAALAAAWRVVEEPRGGDVERILRITDDAHGSWRCHVAYECSEACPSGVDPARAIMRLRRAATAKRFSRILGGGGGR